jgi:hypothetical protein
MPELSEGEARYWDIATKIIGGVVAIITLGIGFKTLWDQGETTRTQQEHFATAIKAQYDGLNLAREEEAKKLEEEYHRRFWEKRLELYSEATDAVSKIASLQLFVPSNQFPSDEYIKAFRRFYQLYYGPLCIVESDKVANAMINFKKTVEAKQGSDAKAQQAYRQSLLDASLDLAYACSEDMQDNWKVEIPNIASSEDVLKKTTQGEIPKIPGTPEKTAP